MMGRSICAAFALLTAACAGQPPLREQAAGGAVINLAEVPRGYMNYTLFVSTSYDYAQLADTDDVKAMLARRFKDFAASIGPNSYAAFVGDSSTQKLDVAAGRTTLDRIKARYGIHADYQDGPYLIVLRNHPGDVASNKQTPAAIALRGRSGTDVALILDELIIEVQKYRPPKGKPAPESETLWQAVQRGWAAGGTSPARKWVSILCDCG